LWRCACNTTTTTRVEEEEEEETWELLEGLNVWGGGGSLGTWRDI